MAVIDDAIVHRLILARLRLCQGSDELAPVMVVTDAGVSPQALPAGLPRATLVAVDLDHLPRTRAADADTAAVTVTVGVELEREGATSTESPAGSVYGISAAITLIKEQLSKAGLYDATSGVSIGLDQCQSKIDPVRAEDGNRRSGVVTVTGVVST